MRRRATGLLVVMTVVFVVARIAEEDGGTWVGYVRATAEAAMVGGLADWFAVTALFRHPLGIPIPHTAIIPTRKDQIGRSLGEFLQANFLSGPVVAERLLGVAPGARLAEWLGRPGSAAIVARHAADAIVAITDALDDDEVRGAIEDLVVSRLRAAPVAPLAGRLLGAVTEGGRHHELLDSLLRGFDQYLVERERRPAGPLRPGVAVVGARVDRRPHLREAPRRPARLRRRGRRRSPPRAARAPRRPAGRAHPPACSTTPTCIARGEAFKEELLAHPALREWTASLWTDAKQAIADQAADPDSPLRQRLESAVTAVGERLATDPALQARVDGGLARLASYVLDEYADDLDEMIQPTVERWDPGVVTGQLELLLGRDLQFIRINGTVVGGLVGLVLHAVSQAIG